MKKFISGFLIGAITLGSISLASAKVFDSSNIEEEKRNALKYSGDGYIVDTTELEGMKIELLEKIYSKLKSIDEHLRIIEANQG